MPDECTWIRYARVDRRPLDPPPVIHLRIFEVQHAGTAAERETELEYELVPLSVPFHFSETNFRN